MKVRKITVNWIYAPEDICGLDKNRLSLTEKMQTIMQNTSLEAEFRKAGMEATL